MKETSANAIIRIILQEELIPKLSLLLNRGFGVKAVLGCSITALLCDQIGIEPEYLEKRIQTIFLNGQPVDDENTAIVHPGSTLALSAAMPGLVGITMRKGGYYRAFRSQISHRGDFKEGTSTEGMVTVKLFNLLLRELGPIFLERGIWIQTEHLREFLAVWGNIVMERGSKIEKNGVECDPESLLEGGWPEERVFLQATAA